MPPVPPNQNSHQAPYAPPASSTLAFPNRGRINMPTMLFPTIENKMQQSEKTMKTQHSTAKLIQDTAFRMLLH
jgi:hypothetical protein